MILVRALFAAVVPALQQPQSAPARELPPLLGLKPDAAREPAPAERPPFRVCGRCIRIAYRGAVGAPPAVTRGKEEARVLAAGLAILARAEGSDFAALARRWSDDEAARVHGGHMGTITPKKEIRAEERALFMHRVGAVIGPIEAREGFFLLERIPVEELAYSEIVITWTGPGRTPRTGRTKDLAEHAATALAALCIAEPEQFARTLEAAADPKFTGVDDAGERIPAPRGSLPPDLEDALAAMPPGGVAGPFETENGYSIVRREENRFVTLDTILVQWKGARGTILSQLRSKPEAEARAKALLAEASKPGARFDKISETSSDDPADQKRGGRYTWAVSKGSPSWIQEAEKLPIGEVRLLESAYGYHIVRRREVERE